MAPAAREPELRRIRTPLEGAHCRVPTLGAPSQASLIVDALTEIFRALASRTENAHVRELRAQARSYDHVVKNWTTVPPGDVQLGAMFELVAMLQRKVAATTRSVR